MVKRYEVHVFPRILNINFGKISFMTFSIILFMKSSLNLTVSLIHSKLFTGSFCNISQPYKLYTSQYLRYDDSLFYS